MLIGLSAACLVLAAAALAKMFASANGQTPFDTIELKTYDWRMSRAAQPASARQDIVLVDIDEASLRNLQPNAGRWPWPRVVHSLVIDYLVRARPTLIVYDVNFAEPDTRQGFRMGEATMSGDDSDRAFVESVRNAGNVILVADATFDGPFTKPPVIRDVMPVPGAGLVERRVVFPPFDAAADAAAGLGHSLFLFDADGPVRHTVPLVRTPNGAVPSLGVAAAMRVLGLKPSDVVLDGTALRIGDRRMPLAWNAVATSNGPVRYLWGLVDFRGPAFPLDATYKHFSFFDLLYSNEQLLAGAKPDVDPSVFRDKIVFVGASASGLADTFETPFGAGKMPGTQVHAGVADDILSNRFMHPVRDDVRFTAVIAAAVIVGAAATMWSVWVASAWAVVAVGGFLFVALRAFSAGTWLNVTQPVLASGLALFGGVAYQYLVEGREKRKLKKLFGQYVSKDVYEQLVADPSRARLGGTRREMTVLFSDIRGFTTVSERGEPEQIVHTLNEYFTVMVEIVFRHKGTLDKFVGDMVMALFGAPLDDPQHADHAVGAALEMIAALGRLNEQWKAEGRPTLDIGIGINTGPMIAGNIGSEAIMSYTVIGDAVNLGSRLESLNKQYGTRIIISAATKRCLSGRYTFRALGDVVVKGKSDAVAIYELVG